MNDGLNAPVLAENNGVLLDFWRKKETEPKSFKILCRLLIIEYFESGGSFLLHGKTYNKKYITDNSVTLTILIDTIYPFLLFCTSELIDNFFNEKKRYFNFEMVNGNNLTCYLKVTFNKEVKQDFLIVSMFMLYCLENNFIAESNRDLNYIQKVIIANRI